MATADLSFFRSETSNRLREEGRAEGRVEGRTRPRGRRHPMLQAKGIDVTQQAQDRIAGCRDADLLRVWLTRAVNATHLDEVFAAE